MRYCADFPPIDRQKIFSALELAGILEIYDRHYRFKYSYFYYYFVAQYLARHIEEPESRKCIVGLCDQFEKEEHANIWLFLTHQSRSQFLLETIASYAKRFFSEIPTPSFDKDVVFLQSLYDKVPELVLVNKSIEEIRQERRKRLDSETASEPDISDATDESNETIRVITQLKASIRTLEVMGQIVKNFAGSMKADPRYTLVKECYELGLRVTGMILKGWESSGEEFIKHVLSVVLEKESHIENREELESMMKNFIFYFCESVSVGILKRISQAVGTKDLADTYRRVLEENQTNAYQLIDLSIKLDHLGLPTGDVFRLNEEFKGNIFCRRLLCRLVINHFYLFSSSDQTKQKVCSKLGIKIDHLRQLDFKTSTQKRLPDASRPT